MVFKRCLLFSVIMVSIFLFTYTAHPATKSEIESLRGLTGMTVLVENLDNEIKKELPFDENQIKVDVELKLRMAGIKILSTEESFNAPGTPYLYVNLNLIRSDFGFIVNLYIQFQQNVYLERNGYKLSASTWITGGTGMYGKQTVSKIRDRIKDNLDIFINDYLSVNPKGGK